MLTSVVSRLAAALMVLLVGVSWGCFDPKDQRPGLFLRGEKVEVLPTDWGFSDAQREIQVAVQTPYWIAHSVTIWCASVDGDLFVAARDPETKRWPGWVDRDPAVRVRIDGRLYEGRLEPIGDAARAARVGQAYMRKYGLDGLSPNMRYWQFAPAA